MKCDGIVKARNKQGKQVTRVCGEKLGPYDIFCHICGKSTSALANDLSARKSLRETWENLKPIRNKSYLFAILMIFLSGITLYLVVLTANNYLYNNLVLLFLIPLLLIPFAGDEDLTRPVLTIRSYLSNLNYYPVYFLFVLINIIYFFLLKVVCTGYLLGLATDPILHLVRFILVIYWLTIVSIVPILIVRKKIDPLKAVRIAYKGGEETRWQQFYILLSGGFAVTLGLLIPVLGLVSIPFFFKLAENYFHRMDRFHLFDR